MLEVCDAALCFSSLTVLSGLSVMYGRHFDQTDRLVSQISRRSINALKVSLMCCSLLRRLITIDYQPYQEFFAKELKPDDIKVLLRLFSSSFFCCLLITTQLQLLIKLKKTFGID
jgi:hypothetical protein